MDLAATASATEVIGKSNGQKHIKIVIKNPL
jgi:hypothetical protein